MRSTHRATLAVALALSVAAGATAATQTVNLGADAKQAPPVSPSALAAEKAKLAAAEGSIHRALAARPPALPPVPKFAPLPEPTVPPLVVTRVVSGAASRSSAGPAVHGGGASEPHRSGSPRPAPAATAPAPAAPRTHVEDDGEEHRVAGREEGDDDHSPDGDVRPERHDD